MKITQTTNHSQYDLNKYSGGPWKQHFYENKTLSSGKLQALLLSLKVQKTQYDSWFYCKQVQEMHQRTLPEAVVYQDHVDKREVLPRHRYKETRILLIYTSAFS